MGFIWNFKIFYSFKQYIQMEIVKFNIIYYFFQRIYCVISKLNSFSIYIFNFILVSELFFFKRYSTILMYLYFS